MTTKIDAALATAVNRATDGAPPMLGNAIRYAVLPGGARIRPRLCMAVAEACGSPHVAIAEAGACAIELLHCASLVHDDLPCFDDAPLRRGKPSVHRVYGEAIALLAGDALIVLAFETMALAGAASPEKLAPMIRTLARAAGSPYGLVSGQAWESEQSVSIEHYHRAKTGSLFVAATMLGALAAGREPGPWRAMGEALGSAYQVADDLLDVLAMPDEAGKPTRQDAVFDRPNIATSLGVSGALAKLRRHVDDAANAVPECPGNAALRSLVLQMAERLVPADLKQTAA